MDLYSHPDLAALADQLQTRLDEQARSIRTHKNNIDIARDYAVMNPVVVVGAAAGAVIGGVVGGIGAGPVGAVAGAMAGAAVGGMAGGLVGLGLSVFIGN
jgi:uncharacterized protein YcfJ